LKTVFYISGVKTMHLDEQARVHSLHIGCHCTLNSACRLTGGYTSKLLASHTPQTVVNLQLSLNCKTADTHFTVRLEL